MSPGPIAIFTIGTQGDVRPCVALGQGLRRMGYPVRIVTSANFGPLVREAGLEFFPLTADFQAMLEADRGIAEQGLNLRAMARFFRQRYAQWAEHWAEEGMAASEGASLLIGSSNCVLLSKALSERHGVPFAIAWLQPLTPSRELPPMVLSAARARLPGALSLAAHRLQSLLMWHVMRPAINDIVRPRLGLPRYPRLGPSLGADALGAKVLNGFSRHVLARPADWPDSVQVTGYWFGDAPAWAPPAALADFLAAGPKPVYIGFGSMVGQHAAALTRIVLDGVRRSGRRAVLATGWGGLEIDEGPLGEQIYGLCHAPHEWLFPRMAAAVHHGGAGTTAAAARAGIPSAIVPFYGDQPFWARCLQRRGVAPAALDRRQLRADGLAAALEAMRQPAMLREARELGLAIRAEDGVGEALRHLRQWGLLGEPAAAGTVRQGRWSMA